MSSFLCKFKITLLISFELNTDGERIIAVYGSAGVFCYDLKGKELWKRDLGKISFEWGTAASPVIHGNLVYIYRGPDPKAHLIALNKKKGKTK